MARKGKGSGNVMGAVKPKRTGGTTGRGGKPGASNVKDRRGGGAGK